MAGLSLTRETALQIDAVTRETAHQIDAVTRFDGLNPSRRRAQFFATRTHKIFELSAKHTKQHFGF